MDNTGYIMVSREAALFRQMDVIANNIANANTLGYKRETMLFKEYLAGQNQVNQSSFTEDVSTYSDMAQGPLRVTNRPMDAAIKGEGFFEIETPLGLRYSRVGNFQVNSEGELVTAQGYRVMSTSGPIVFSDDDLDVSIREDGTIFVKRPGGAADEERGTLKVMKFKDPEQLKKLPGGIYAAADDDAGDIALVKDDFTVSQGVLEDSNVNSTTEMTQMIEVSRAVGTTAGFLKDLDDLARKAVTTIARQQ